MNISVVGLGKIGLPLAVQFATRGHRVIGADVNDPVVELVNAGRAIPRRTDLSGCYGKTLSQGGCARPPARRPRSPRATRWSSWSPSSSTPRRPGLRLDGLGDADVARGLRPGTLVSYETTLPVGTTRNRWPPMLEAGSGLAGHDFSSVFSPERVLTGRVFSDLRRYPKLVGGSIEGAASRGVEFYEAVLDFDDRPDLARPNGVWDLGRAEATELAKLAETTFRDVNIGLANQFARSPASGSTSPR